MNCLECQELLQRRLDGGSVPASPDLERHLAGCQSCRQNHLAAQALLDGVRAAPRPALPDNFTDRMVVAVLQDRMLRQQRMQTRLRVTMAMAASILLMAFAGYLWLPTPPTTREERPLAHSVDEARDAVARLADQTKDQARLLIAAAPTEVPMPEMPNLAALDQPLDPAAESLRQAKQGLAHGFSTVARNARRAVDYFVRELPDLEPAANN